MLKCLCPEALNLGLELPVVFSEMKDSWPHSQVLWVTRARVHQGICILNKQHFFSSPSACQLWCWWLMTHSLRNIEIRKYWLSLLEEVHTKELELWTALRTVGSHFVGLLFNNGSFISCLAYCSSILFFWHVLTSSTHSRCMRERFQNSNLTMLPSLLPYLKIVSGVLFNGLSFSWG